MGSDYLHNTRQDKKSRGCSWHIEGGLQSWLPNTNKLTPTKNVHPKPGNHNRASPGTGTVGG